LPQTQTPQNKNARIAPRSNPQQIDTPQATIAEQYTGERHRLPSSLNLRMEATSSGAVGAKPRSGWTDREIGFVLNFADLCLRDQMDFKRLVAAELSKFTNREFTAIAIDSKIRKTLSQHCSAKYADLINKGTQSLDVRKLPGQVLEHMQPQRASWGLDELSTATESEGSAAKGSEDVISGEVAVSMQNQRRADRG
jgi:hypothetical protein